MAKRKQSVKASQPYQVFLSHATADKWIAKQLCQQVESVGAVTFRDDRDIAGGDDIPEQLRTAISESAELLVLLTPESVSRPWVILEIGAAWGIGTLRIIAVLCHVPVASIPAILQRYKAIPLNDFDQYLAELADRVCRANS